MTRARRAVPVLLLLAGLWLLAGSTSASERIVAFHSDVEVHADGQLTVRETIQVESEGRQIKRGIYRDFPTTYRDRLGRTVRVPFEVLETLRDGQPEPRRQESLANGVRTYLGQASVLLRPGRYTYTIVYRTARQLGFFAEHDELYWNVTGNDWEFPIDRASAAVAVPPGVPRESLRLEAYTGPQGARGRDWTASIDERGRAAFATTAPLASRAGLTIVVAWPKGHVAAPSALERARWFARDNWAATAGAAGGLLLLAYYLWAWWRVGRDPARGVVIPRFEAPGGLSPAATRYVWRMGFDDRAFAAALIGLAVKGHLAIAQDGQNGYRLKKREATGTAGLSAGERAAVEALFRGHPEVALRTGSHARVGPARSALRDALAREHDTVHFRRNRGWLLPGVALSGLTVLVAAIGEGLTGSAGGVVLLFMSLWLSVWTVGTAMLWTRRSWFMAAIFSLFGLGALAMLAFAGPLGAPVLLLGLAATNVAFHHLLRAPTGAGRRLLDEIEGLRMYLSVAERDRLAALHPPAETPETFERFLPYAFALDVDQQWAERFATVLQAREGQPAYAPGWYSGSRLSGAGPTGLASSLAGLGTAVAAAASPPGSSSGGSGGGGGGGSSGGGGGGGGGGGW